MKPKQKFTQIFIFCIILLAIYSFSRVVQKVQLGNINSEISKIYPGNNYYVTNNNMALYSSYIIIDDANKLQNQYTIEAIAEYRNYKYDLNLTDNIKCILKYLKDENNVEIIELHPTDFANITVHLTYVIAIKYYFNFKLDYFKSYKDELKSFDLNKIIVAVISKNDFDETINEVSFLANINPENLKKNTVLPYSLIAYQKPTIIKTQKLLTPNIAVCGAQFYGNPSKELFNWIDYQQSFGIAELIIYDGTINRTTTKFINDNFKNYKNIKITMVPDQSLFYEQCSEDIFYKQFENRNSTKLNDLLFNLCQKLFHWSHRSTPRKRNPVGYSSDKHRIVVLNDCFIKISRKYEFVAIYDFDEFIFPRTFDLEKDQNKVYDCSDKKQICDRKPFEFNNTINNGKHLYNYVISLIKNDEHNRNISELAAVEFDRHLTLSNTQKVEKNVIDMLHNFVLEINSSTKFPIYFDMIEQFSLKIFEYDIDYVLNLVKSYKRLVPCIYRDYLKDIEIIDTDKVRAIYFLYGIGTRTPKSFFYSKNVRSLGIHIVTDIVNGSWIMKPDAKNGHYCSHYRAQSTKMVKAKHSIRILNIDFEYLAFILKRYTKFC
jgi:hypothetical protein